MGFSPGFSTMSLPLNPFFVKIYVKPRLSGVVPHFYVVIRNKHLDSCILNLRYKIIAQKNLYIASFLPSSAFKHRSPRQTIKLGGKAVPTNYTIDKQYIDK